MHKISLTTIHLDITKMMYGEDRLKNAIGFETDKKLLGGVQFNIMTQQGESSTVPVTGTTGDNSARDGSGDGIPLLSFMITKT